MTVAYLSLAMAAALCFYLASVHQRLWTGAAGKAHVLRVVGWAGTAASVFTAVTQLGLWAGVFASLTALMLALVLLPYLDAARRLGRRPSR